MYGFSILVFVLFVSPWSAVGAILLLLFLLFCSAMISGSEVAYFSLTPAHLMELEAEKSPSGKRVIHLRTFPRRLLFTILITNNLVNIAIVILSDFLIWNLISQDHFLQWGSAIYSLQALDFIGPEVWARVINFLLTVIGVTFLLVLFGEVAPKIYAKMNNIRLARFMSLPLTWLFNFISPLSNMMVGWTNGLEHRLSKSGRSGTNKEDIDKAIDLAMTQNSSSQKEADILKGIVKFNDVPVKQVMRSRVDVVATDIKTEFIDLMKIVKDSGFSRIPVYEEDLDNITGILYVKDLVGFHQETNGYKWQDLVKTDVLYIPESKKINELLKEMQKERLHMAIVVDEYGGNAGIVTLEDVMEEVLGEIRDEFDTEEELEFRKIDDLNYIFEGKTLINDVCRTIGAPTTVFDSVRGDADSLAGLILEIKGHMPPKGDVIRFEGFSFRILEVSKRRIEKILLKLEAQV